MGKQEIEKFIILNEIETNKGVEIIYPNGESKVFFGEDKDELYYLVDSDFVSAYIDNKPNRIFIDKIYLKLKNSDEVILEII